MAGIANLLDFADPVCRIADRRHPDHQPSAGGPGGLGTQSADGDVAGQARRRLVGTETRGRGLSMPRGHLHAPALANHFRGVGFRPRRARQHQPFLPAAARIRSTQPQPIEATRLRMGGLQLIWQRREAISQLFAAFERPTYAAACDFGNFRDR